MKKIFLKTLLVSMMIFCMGQTVHAKIPGVVGTFTSTSSTIGGSPEFAEEVTFGGETKHGKMYHLAANEKLYNASGICESETVVKNPEATAYCSETYMVMDLDVAVKSGNGTICIVPADNIPLSGAQVNIADLSKEEWHRIRAVIQPGTRYGVGGNDKTYANVALYLDDAKLGENTVNVIQNFLYTEKQYKFRVNAGSDGAELCVADFKVWATNDAVDGTTLTPAPPEPGPDPEPEPEPEPEPSEGAEVIYGFEFNTEGDAEGWETSGTAETNVADGVAKFSLRNNAWIVNKTSARYDGGEVYKMVMRARITDAAKPTDAATPYVRLYYTSYAADGSKLNQSEARKTNFSYTNLVQKDNGLFDSEWEEYEVDLSDVPGFSTAKSIEDIRLDVLKNSSSGTVEIDYIRFYSLPGVDQITYDGGKSITDGIQGDFKTIEIKMTQPLYAVPDNSVKIVDEDGGEIRPASVSYDAGSQSIVLHSAGELLSSTQYTVVLTNDVRVTKNQTLYKEIKAGFRTKRASVDFWQKSGDGESPVITVSNDSGSADKLYLAATYWLNNMYQKKTIIPITFANGSQDFEIEYAGDGYNRVEVSLLKVVDERIISVGSRVFQYEKY